MIENDDFVPSKASDDQGPHFELNGNLSMLTVKTDQTAKFSDARNSAVIHLKFKQRDQT